MKTIFSRSIMKGSHPLGTSLSYTYYLRTAFLVLVALLLATAAGLAQRKSIKQYVHEIWKAENGLPQNSAASMTQTRDGYIWFGTQEGLARFDGVEFTVFNRTNTPELDASNILRILEDREGGLWVRVSAFSPRLVRYFNGKFTPYDSSDGLATNRTTSWISGRDSSVWIGTLSGLSRYKEGKFTNYTTGDGLPADTVFALTEDSQNRLWISTPRGLARYADGRFETLTGQPGFPDTVIFRTNDFNNVFEDSRGTFWMAARGSIIAYSETETKRYSTRDGLPTTNVGAIHEDKKGNIWFGTTAGLLRFADGRFTSYTISSDRDENSIIQIEEDSEGSLWLATGKGIARFADGAFEQYKSTDGLSDNAVQRILIDTEGSIWVSTFGGGVDKFRDEKFVTYSSRVGLSYDMVDRSSGRPRRSTLGRHDLWGDQPAEEREDYLLRQPQRYAGERRDWSWRGRSRAHLDRDLPRSMHLRERLPCSSLQDRGGQPGHLGERFPSASLGHLACRLRGQNLHLS